MVAPQDPTQEAVKRLRSAAVALRDAAEGSPFITPPITLAVADWLDGEASMIGALEPMVDLLNMLITNASGTIGEIKLGRLEDGAIDMRLESTPAALRLADLILARPGGAA